MPFGGFVLLKALGRGGGGGARERGRNQFLMLSPWLGRGWPESLGLTKRQCGLVTVRGKHRATNGVVMGGEEPGKSWYKESWPINSGGVTSPLAGGQGPLFPLPSANRGSRSQGGGQGEGRLGGEKPAGVSWSAGPQERMDRKERAFSAESRAPG